MESLLLLPEEMVMSQKTTCRLIPLCEMRVISIPLTDIVHCGLLEVPQKLDSILLFMFGWITFRNLQSNVVYSRISLRDGYLVVRMCNTLYVLQC